MVIILSVVGLKVGWTAPHQWSYLIKPGQRTREAFWLALSNVDRQGKMLDVSIEGMCVHVYVYVCE